MIRVLLVFSGVLWTASAFTQPKAEPKTIEDALRQFEASAFPKPLKPAAGVIRPPQNSADEKPAPSASKTLNKRWFEKLRPPDLPIRFEPKLVQYLEFYKNHARGRAIMRTWLQRRGRYRRLIERKLRQYKLPSALIYLAMIESGFSPHRTSRVGAAGLWQFMTHNGATYGLKVDYWIDERRNPELSTDAAMRNFAKLKQRLGSWELVLAAYNAGFGGVVVAMQKYNTNDYWRLCTYEAGLPWSTTYYVPKVLATALVGTNPSFFGFSSVKPDPELRYDLVEVPHSITLKQAAKLAGTTLEMITLLNPELRRLRTPPYQKAAIRVPKGTAKQFRAGYVKLTPKLARYRAYTLRLGDTLRTVARRFRTSSSRLRRLNRVKHRREIKPGLTLLVPRLPKRRPRKAKPARKAATDQRQEDQPVFVALPEGVPNTLPGKQRVFYQTALGDRIEQIAKYMGVQAHELRSWNKLSKRASLVSGMVLQAFVPSREALAGKVRLLEPSRVKLFVSSSEAFLNSYEQRRGRVRLTYRVRRRDTLKRISRRFGLSVGSIMRINGISRRAKLTRGQPLILYVDKARWRPRKRRPKRRRSRRS